MYYGMEQIEVDNRDSLTTWLRFPNGIILEVTLQDLQDLIQNMNDNAVKEER
jgi:hypothetical protein